MALDSFFWMNRRQASIPLRGVIFGTCYFDYRRKALRSSLTTHYMDEAEQLRPRGIYIFVESFGRRDAA